MKINNISQAAILSLEKMLRRSLDFQKIENGILRIKMIDLNNFLELLLSSLTVAGELIKDFVRDDVE